MQLTTLLERMKMEHLLAQLDGVCEQASKSDLDYKAFLAQALDGQRRRQVLPNISYGPRRSPDTARGIRARRAATRPAPAAPLQRSARSASPQSTTTTDEIEESQLTGQPAAS